MAHSTHPISRLSVHSTEACTLSLVPSVLFEIRPKLFRVRLTLRKRKRRKGNSKPAGQYHLMRRRLSEKKWTMTRLDERRQHSEWFVLGEENHYSHDGHGLKRENVSARSSSFVSNDFPLSPSFSCHPPLDPSPPDCLCRFLHSFSAVSAHFGHFLHYFTRNFIFR